MEYPLAEGEVIQDIVKAVSLRSEFLLWMGSGRICTCSHSIPSSSSTNNELSGLFIVVKKALIFLSNCDELTCMEMDLSSRIISSELIVFRGIKYCNSTYTANSVKMLAISLGIV